MIWDELEEYYVPEPLPRVIKKGSALIIVAEDAWLQIQEEEIHHVRELQQKQGPKK